MLICLLTVSEAPLTSVLNLNSWHFLTVHKPPVEQRVVDEGLQHSHNAVPVLPQHLHHCVARDPVVTIQARHLTHMTFGN